MNRIPRALGFALALLLVCSSVRAPVAVAQAQGYTVEEYNAYTAAHNEQDPNKKIKLLDDFAAKFPNSELNPYIYRDYYLTYYQLKNYPKTTQYADKMLSLGDKVDTQGKIEALAARAQAFFFGSTQPELSTEQQLRGARNAAEMGLQVLPNWNPPNVAADQLAQQKKGLATLFNSIAGIASLQLKDYQAAARSFRAALELDGKDALNHYRLGVALLQQDPPQYMDGFWELARAIALKAPSEASVRSYLEGQLRRYQLTGCDDLLKQQMNELLSLATSSPTRPPDYRIPSAADLQRVREETGANFLTALRGGGAQAKMVFLATCGLPFDEVGGKLIDVAVNGDQITLMVFAGATAEETTDATTSNMEVRITGQPEAARVEKNGPVKFSATLKGYTPEPFLLVWDDAKVTADSIPAEAAQPPKRPGKRGAR